MSEPQQSSKAAKHARIWFISSSLIVIVVASCAFWILSHQYLRAAVGSFLMLASLTFNDGFQRMLEMRIKLISAPHYQGIMREQRTFGAVLIVCTWITIFVGALLAKERHWDRASLSVLSMGLGIGTAYCVWLAGRCILFLRKISSTRKDVWISIGFLLSGAYCIVVALGLIAAFMNV